MMIIFILQLLLTKKFRIVLSLIHIQIIILYLLFFNVTFRLIFLTIEAFIKISKRLISNMVFFQFLNVFQRRVILIFKIKNYLLVLIYII